MRDLIYRAAKKASDSDPTLFVLSDESVDRHGEVVTVDGWDLKSFHKRPTALLNHNPDAIIGKWRDVRVEGKRLLGRLVLAEEGTDEVVDKVRKWWDQDLIGSASVGFIDHEREPLTEAADPYWGPFRYLKQELLEASLVTIPANSNAIAINRSLAPIFRLPAGAQAQLFGVSAKKEFSKPLAPPRVPAKTSSDPIRGPAMKTTLTKQIETAQGELTRLRDQLNELAGLDERDEEQELMFSELSADNGAITATERRLETLMNAEKRLAFKAPVPAPAVELEPVDPPRPFATPKKKIEFGDYVFRAAALSLRAFATQTPIERLIKDNYGGDEATLIVTKAAVNPAMTTVPGYAQELVQTGFGAFMDRLIANSIYAPLADSGTRYDLGRNGTLKIPYRAATPQASGAWVGEGSPKPVKRIGLSTVTLTPHKVACITTYTEEMANSSVPAIEGILRKAMADDTQASLDGFLIDAVAESATRPAGLLVGVTPITAAATGTTLEKIVADISALIAPMEAAGGGGKIVLIMNPAQARKLGMVQTTTGDFAFGSASEAAAKFGVVRIISSTTVPAGRVIAVDADWFATATGDAPRFAVSNEATLHEEDTTPLALGVAGSPNTVAAPMRSLFQTDSIAIRLSLFVTWAMVRTGMVQTIAAVGW
jgi:HK97 family phage major capsid protein